MKTVLSSLLTCLITLGIASASEDLLKDKRTILILGDSITQAGHYVTDFDAWLVKRYPDKRFTVINAGVSSETISGLSEEGHAGGRFPRPDLHERLERVLTTAKPDLIIACYGMNCGIYQALDEARFKAYRDGTTRLREAAKKHGAEVVHVTPPIYDHHGKGGFDYDEVLTKYAKWLVDQRENGWHVADLHSEMRAKVDALKKDDPKFTYQGDKVHPNRMGHWLMAQCLMAYFGDQASAELKSPNDLLPEERYNAVRQRMTAYQKAIHAETKPLRPGVPKGGTMESASEEAKKLEGAIYNSNPSGGHLFILSGQSNMTGGVAKGFTEVVTEKLGGNATIVHHCKPGRGIRFWVADYPLPETHPMAGLAKDKSNGQEYPRLLELAKAKGDATKFKTVTFVWMQGESDAQRDLGEAYEKSFLALTSKLKEDLGIEQMNFVIGRISDWGLHHPDKKVGWEKMRTVQMKLADDDANGAWIDTDDLIGDDHKNPKGNLHYLGDNQTKLGKRFAEKVLEFLAK